MIRWMSIIIIMILSLNFHDFADGASRDFDKIRITVGDLPEGFIYGKVPAFARKVLKDNPWKFDKNAIRKLAGQIYPGGDHTRIAEIHVTIMTGKETPFGDDMVCYIIQYKDARSARLEIKKIMEFAGFNKDRVILMVREEMVVYMHADDVKNFPLLKKIAKIIEERLASFP